MSGFASGWGSGFFGGERGQRQRSGSQQRGSALQQTAADEKHG
jgi:hypothetical protein